MCHGLSCICVVKLVYCLCQVEPVSMSTNKDVSFGVVKFPCQVGRCRLTDMLLADCRKEEDVDPEQIRKDIERLQLIKQKR